MSKTKYLSLLKDHLIDPVTRFIFQALCVVCDQLLTDHEKIFCNSCRDNLIPLKQDFISKLKDEIDSREFDRGRRRQADPVHQNRLDVGQVGESD